MNVLGYHLSVVSCRPVSELGLLYQVCLPYAARFTKVVKASTTDLLWHCLTSGLR